MKMAELIDYVATYAGIDRKFAKKATEAVLAGVLDAAKRGDVVSMSKFGKFMVKEPSEASASDGDDVKPASVRTLRFVASKSLRESLIG